MPQGIINSIRPEELFAISRTQPVCIVDVRFPNAFQKWRAKNTKNIPLYRATVETLAMEIAPEETLYIMCKDGSVGRHIVETYGNLFHTQNRKILYVEGGLKAWEKQGLPTYRKRSIWSHPEFQCGFLVWSLILLFTLLAAFIHRGFLGITSFIMAGIVYFSTLSDATPLTNLIAKMPWNQNNKKTLPPEKPLHHSEENSTQQAPLSQDSSRINPSENSTQQASSHQITQD
ncbi:MAG: rhodanese-like domain-containing protein [Gemmataceae bacterium]|nr:rhodanese-like domain-containing protein [Gemmataceae bacterium]